MKKKLKASVITLLVIGATGCSTATVSFWNRMDNNRYKIKIPKEYHTKVYTTAAEEEKRYVYSDSSVIYITNFLATPNYENIKATGDSVLKLRYQDEDLTREIRELLGEDGPMAIPDTLVLSGNDSGHLYWKDIKIGKLSIGYMNVPASKKAQFDKALESLVIK